MHNKLIALQTFSAWNTNGHICILKIVIFSICLIQSRNGFMLQLHDLRGSLVPCAAFMGGKIGRPFSFLENTCSISVREEHVFVVVHTPSKMASRVFVALSKAKMISPEGTSKPFSSRADGYGRGEGCGVVLLKPLKKVRRCRG